MSASNAERTPQGARQIGYWAATTAVAVLFAVPGVALLARVPHFTQDMSHLGYPAYFVGMLGVWKILGAATVAAPRLPRLKEWAYAGMLFDATSAAVSRAALDDGFFKIAFPIAIAAIALVSWALRPSTRRLHA